MRRRSFLHLIRVYRIFSLDEFQRQEKKNQNALYKRLFAFNSHFFFGHSKDLNIKDIKRIKSDRRSFVRVN